MLTMLAMQAIKWVCYLLTINQYEHAQEKKDSQMIIQMYSLALKDALTM